jgi:putative two-component system response regulator
VSLLAKLSTALEERSPEAVAHSRRVLAIVEALGARLCWDERRLAAARVGSVLHDIGKLSVRPEVLRKPGPLDDAELA